MAINKLTYNGDDYDDEIVAGAGGLDMQHAMVGETLSVDTLSLAVISGDRPEIFLAADQAAGDWFMTADGHELCCTESHPVPAYVAGGAGKYYFGTDLLGQYYLDELHRTGANERQMLFYSAIRLLDRSKHFGGLYTGETADVVAADIIGSIVAYTIDPDIAAIQVYGYLPYASRRDNLQMLLMAIGAALRNASDGSLQITSLSESSTGTIDATRVFMGGSATDNTPATAVQVTEHNYIESTEDVTLYDATTVNTETVVFREPIHTLSITGGTIVASGVNYCTFTGAGAVALTGKRYTHIMRVLTHGTAPTGAGSDNVKSISRNTLLSPNNAAQVAENLYNYLTVAQTIRAEVVLATERPGDVVSVLHPYTGAMVAACIKSMNISFGATELRAMAEMLVGYVPAGMTAGFENYAVLTGSGSWTVPAGVTSIRVIIVGGGDGGGNGENGAASVRATTEAAAVGGAGGDAGVAGVGGLILEINLVVTPGASLAYVCAAAAAAATAGGATTFNTYSSALGRRYPYGYSEPKSALTLANDGADGAAGGAGNAWNQTPQTVAFGGTTYNPGTTGTTLTFYQPSIAKNTQAIGGGGGGAAVGATGGNGGNGTNHYAGSGEYVADHGAGGTGATAAVAGANAANYGGGGSGGHGGGGGGFVIGNLPDRNDTPGTVGAGGSGSAGGQGGAGCVVVYF